MALADHRFTRSEASLSQTGYAALIQSLGYADAIRFPIQLNPGTGDYLEWQNDMFGDTSVDELYEQAASHWKRAKK
jgi:hypothetical protein